MNDIKTLQNTNETLEMIIKLMMEGMIEEGVSESRTKEILNKAMGKAIFEIMKGLEDNE